VRPAAFVFTYAFDPNSYMKRKNPVALARAFRAAFLPDDQGVALLLRANGKLQRGPDRRALRQAIGTDRRITLMEATLERTEALALLASCDCLVSPHRAEGFGRNIAEAILLQKPVLATAFSGCLDFLQPSERLSFAPRKVGPGEYPFAEGLEWADPDITDMAAKLQLVRKRMRRSPRDERRRLALRARNFARTFSPQAAGRLFAGRLTALGVIEPRPDRLQLRVPTGQAAQPVLIPETTFATGC
jgi:glycosyltransferase involved in cell wall biosynthesis